MSMKKNKIAGAIYGFAVGDAMGATTEFMTENQIKAIFGKVTDIVGGGWLHLEPGQVTDDTQMTMCVMDAAIKSGGHEGTFEKHCINNFIRWYRSNPPDVGGQCANGIMLLMCGERTRNTKSAGNGSLMRALPCALLDWKGLNILQSKLTHPSIECTMAIKQYHEVIQDTLNDNCEWKQLDKLSKNMSLEEPTGYVKNTLRNAFIWANESTFKQCIIGAVNHGGDADTIAAIAGGLAGARFGYEAIPQKWIDKLDSQVKTKLNEFIAFCMRR